MRASRPKLGVAIALACAACGGSGESAPPRAPTEPRAAPAAPQLASDEASFGKFHSKRFQLTVPLPEGHDWKIDDHSRPYLYAVHEPTSSRLSLEVTRGDELVNHGKCEERARAEGRVPQGELTTVEDAVTVGPDAFDSRVWVALDPGKPGGEVEGHVFLFGAYVRTCLFVHVATRVGSSKDLDALSSRLALARTRIVEGIVLDAPRTNADAPLPRDKPGVRR